MSDTVNENRRGFLSTTVKTIAGVQLGMIGPLLHPMTPASGQTAGDRELQSLRRATEWLNSPPLTATALRGRVVLIDFWTYTCINWMRTLPHIRAWFDKYSGHGLIVTGVHAPEFSFEHDLQNVRQAAQHLGVTHPIAVDNDFAIWRAFRNRYWPALYLVDAQGRIRHHQFGEGDYEQAEAIIQQLLTEAGIDGAGDDAVSVEVRGVEAAADWGSLKSPETYLGHARTENFASPGDVRSNRRHVYTAPARLTRNQWALSGDWTVESEAAVLHEGGGRLLNCFHARDLHLVMGPTARGEPVRFRVRIDGQMPGAAHGLDLDEGGNGMATEQRMYQLIRQTNPIADRQFEIEFLDSGVAAFAFTFG